MKISVSKTGELAGHRDSIYCLAPGPDTDSFYSGAGDGLIVKWNLAEGHNGKVVAETEGAVYAMQYLKDSNRLLAGTNSGVIIMLDLEANQLVTQAKLNHGIFDLKVVPGQDFMIVAGAEGYLKLLLVDTLQELLTLRPSQRNARCIALHPSQPVCAIGFSDGDIRVFSSHDLKPFFRFEGHQFSTFCLQFTQDEIRLLSGGRDAHLKSWLIHEEYAPQLEVPAHLFTINRIAQQPGGRLLATASRDKSVKIWDSRSFELLKVIDAEKFNAHVHSVNHLIWLDEERLVTAGDDKRILVWRIIIEE
ncbi:MAG: WD40 repeat domain-containing protein [Bacteroidia bacterium]